MNGLDLFSGIGGISKALEQWVRPLAYCEIDKYCQGVLLCRMADGHLVKAPIWDDIRSFPGGIFEGGVVDIITAGFPCQDISVAGNGKGLEGERSGLFFEIVRLAKEIKPKFLFLENVPAITTRGGLQVVSEIAALGYDCRWCIISAASVGALHRRERWFLLAHAKHDGASTDKIGGSIRECAASGKESEQSKESFRETKRTSSLSSDVAHATSSSSDRHAKREEETYSMLGNSSENVCNFYSIASPQANQLPESELREGRAWGNNRSKCWPFESREHWQKTVSEMGKCSNGISKNLDGIDLIEGSMLIHQYASTNEICPEEVLSLLQRGNIASSLQEWEATSTIYIPEKEILFEFMRLCGQKCKQASCTQELISQSSSKTPREFLRGMRSRKKPASASCGSQSQKQRIIKHPDTLQDLSQLLAQSFKSAWIKKCRQDAQDHVAQLRALGNSVVPQQCKEAFEILMGLKS